METTDVLNATGSSALSNNATAQALQGEDFFKLLIAQLSNQDPLNPTSNQELLQQISSIRDIELSTALVDSLSALSSQQQYGSAASLIGRFVSGADGNEDGTGFSGVVVGVRFDDSGAPLLQLSGGQELPLSDLFSVIPAEEAARGLMGKFVTGIDTEGSNDAGLIQGVVTGISTDSQGAVTLELDSGQTLSLSNVTGATELDDASETVV